MKQLVLHFTETRLQLLSADPNEPLVQALAIDFSKPFVRDHISSAIKEALQQHTLGQLVWFGPDYTLFPLDLFDPNQIATYYQLNHGKPDPNKHLCYQLIEKAGLALIFSIPVWLYDYAKYELQTTAIKHAVGMQLLQSPLLGQKNQVTLCIEEKYFVLISIKNGQLQGAYTNPYQQDSDLLYFLLAQQQKIQLPTPLPLVIYDATAQFNLEQLVTLLQQFKDFEHYLPQLNNSSNYQNQILCASSEAR